MDHEAESHRIADARPAEATGHPTSEVPAPGTATPMEMLRQLTRQLRASQASQLSARDPFGTTFPGQDDSWDSDNALRKQRAQYLHDLRASMSLDQLGEVVTNDARAVLDRLDKIAAVVTAIEMNRWLAMRAKGKTAFYAGMVDLFVQAAGWIVLPGNALIKLNAWLSQVEHVRGDPMKLEVAKYKFAEFLVALGLLPVAALRGAGTTQKHQKSGPPTIQAPTPWQRLIPDWRNFLPRPLTVVASGPGGGAAIDGWIGDPSPRALPSPVAGPYFHSDSAPDFQADSAPEHGPLGPIENHDSSGLSATVPLAPTSPHTDHLEKLTQFYLDYRAHRLPADYDRLGRLLAKEVRISYELLARLLELQPFKFTSMVQAERFLHYASSSNEELRQYVEQLSEAYAYGVISRKSFEHYVRTAEALLNMPEATDLERAYLGGHQAFHYYAIVDGQKVFLKVPRDADLYPESPYPANGPSTDVELRAPRDMMSRDGVKWYLLVRTRDVTLGWREAIAMELVNGVSLQGLRDKMIAQKKLPIRIHGSHVRGVRAFQERARIGEVNIQDGHYGNVLATEDLERPVVHVDATAEEGVPYSLPIAAHDPLLAVKELAEYSRLTANGNQPLDAVQRPTPQDVVAAKATLDRVLTRYNPQQPNARSELVGQVRRVWTQLGVDKSICELLVPQLDVSHFQTLMESNGLLEGLTSPDEQLRLHYEDLIWEYGAGRLLHDRFERFVRVAKSVVSLPPVVGLSRFHLGADGDLFRGTLNGRAVYVKLPPPDMDYRVDEYLHELRDKHRPVLVRALNPTTRIWQRGVAW